MQGCATSPHCRAKEVVQSTSFLDSPLIYTYLLDPSKSLVTLEITTNNKHKTHENKEACDGGNRHLQLSPGFATLCTLEKVRLARGEPLQLFAEVKAGSR
jgi:hypothetical protein